MELPEYFEKKFRGLMDAEEYALFINAFDEKRVAGLRLNTLKIDPPMFERLFGEKLTPVPWVPEGYYFEDLAPGKHPYYHAGLFYIQEPSAMMPARVLSPEPGERVLDLCAAPGGKTTQLACMMRNAGLIVSNDISPKRVKALVKNVELMGISNALVTNETPERLARVFPEFFDRILLDVPCSGEGMFRKDREAIQSYSRYKSEECVAMQRAIFEQAYAMLKPGGMLVYSTCTFNPDENERNMAFFVKEYHLEPQRIPDFPGWERSRGEWSGDDREKFSAGLRLWPHKAKGEGHFVFLLKKPGNLEEEDHRRRTLSAAPDADQPAPGETACTGKEAERALEAFKAFEQENMNTCLDGVFHVRDGSLYRLPSDLPEVPGLRWEKAGLYLGEFRKGRFEPSGSLAMAMRMENFRRVLNLPLADHRVVRYLKGETLFHDGEKGYAVVCVDGFPLGWGKQEGGTLKNLYPKSWRMQ
ncbi:RsmF rRNA methyltransferase first C-terminal domain-containing protein [Thermoclostridium caenicola]|uniref:NOL1/NOP2/sun family putative RNA methylase n=1 Tax=Thermoclostridium caenicola TaxID=659425 RepID=A0A1M6JRL2_9FIRM|nr:RsmB/NOP family class I SAM-dependent RNA methyltransferase [Thermoclostridium caenicola]SHJ49250.1 NOL1/NOP2/sun family putative RNA methylase [Thermoclostridium caenicola]HOP72667.1 RsmB/NOP family class I SAM-dependent RNA methyltransferase [Thermoclostridium caenicola]